MDGWSDEQTDRWMDGLLYSWRGGIDGLMDGWTDSQTD